MASSASKYFAKLAQLQLVRLDDDREQFLQRMRQVHSRLGMKMAHTLEPQDSVDTLAVKTAANLLGLLKLLRSGAGSHLLGASLYAPLIAADAAEAHHQRQQGKSGLMPALASGALAVMMAQHAAPLVAPMANKLMQKYQPGAKIQSFLSSLGAQK